MGPKAGTVLLDPRNRSANCVGHADSCSLGRRGNSTITTPKANRPAQFTFQVLKFAKQCFDAAEIIELPCLFKLTM